MAFFILDGDEPSSSVENPAPAPTDGEDYIDLAALDDGEVPSGGLGNDTIVSELDAPRLGPLDGGDGDDVIIENNVGDRIDGGAGNDSITVNGPALDARIEGGSGNDTITGTATYDGDSTVSGGAGDDLITLEFNYGPGQNLTLDGGDGDDTIRFDHSPSNGNSDGTVQTVIGGAGADRIEVELREGFIDVDRPQFFETPPGLTPDGTIETIPSLVIADFQPGIDRLVLEAEPDAEAVYRQALESYENSLCEDGRDTLVTYRLFSEANDRLVQGAIVPQGTTSVNESDIVFEPLTPTFAV